MGRRAGPCSNPGKGQPLFLPVRGSLRPRDPEEVAAPGRQFHGEDSLVLGGAESVLPVTTFSIKTLHEGDRGLEGETTGALRGDVAVDSEEVRLLLPVLKGAEDEMITRGLNPVILGELRCPGGLGMEGFGMGWNGLVWVGKGLVRDGRVWYGLEGFGTDWKGLVRIGRVWYGLEGFGTA